MTNSYSLILHGGAGAIQTLKFGSSEEGFQQSINAILHQGRQRLERGDSALDVVEYCVSLLENDPLYNAGRGSVLNAKGKVEMDAALMNGADLRAGSVACVSQIKNPISLARQVLDHGQQVLLVADGAMEFAKLRDVDFCPEEYFVTPMRVKQWEAAQAAGTITLDHERVKPEKLGTVGAVAYDLNGDLAAATSTGGLVNNSWGRVGDSPIIGAGVYADNESCAVSATGYGEAFLRTVLSKTIAMFVQWRGMDVETATQAGIEYLVNRVQGQGGVIAIDAAGRCASAQSTTGMVCGWIEHGGESHYTLG